MLRVLLADRDPLFLHSLTAAASRSSRLQVTGVAHTGRAAIAAIRALRFDVALLDGSLPDLVAPLILYALLRDGAGPAARPAFMLDDPGSENGIRLLRAGAGACLLKSATPDRLCAALPSVARGDAVAAPDLGVIGRLERGASAAERVPEDRGLLLLLAEGLTPAAIAAVSRSTEGAVLRRIEEACAGLGVAERHAAVAEALARGWIP